MHERARAGQRESELGACQDRDLGPVCGVVCARRGLDAVHEVVDPVARRDGVARSRGASRRADVLGERRCGGGDMGRAARSRRERVGECGRPGQREPGLRLSGDRDGRAVGGVVGPCWSRSAVDDVADSGGGRDRVGRTGREEVRADIVGERWRDGGDDRPVRARIGAVHEAREECCQADRGDGERRRDPVRSRALTQISLTSRLRVHARLRCARRDCLRRVSAVPQPRDATERVIYGTERVIFVTAAVGARPLGARHRATPPDGRPGSVGPLGVGPPRPGVGSPGWR